MGVVLYFIYLLEIFDLFEVRLPPIVAVKIAMERKRNLQFHMLWHISKEWNGFNYPHNMYGNKIRYFFWHLQKIVDDELIEFKDFDHHGVFKYLFFYNFN